MAAFADAIVSETRFGPEVQQYLERIDETLRPYGGKFVIHGGPYHKVEGVWSSDLIVIEFPDMASAMGWYQSPQYQAIKPLRANNTTGTVLLVEGVPAEHRATDILK
jgi:uncharacterized protein (DUF1330 family)